MQNRNQRPFFLSIFFKPGHHFQFVFDATVIYKYVYIISLKERPQELTTMMGNHTGASRLFGSD